MAPLGLHSNVLGSEVFHSSLHRGVPMAFIEASSRGNYEFFPYLSIQLDET